MDLKTAILAIRTAIDEIPGLSAPGFTPKSPDVLIQEGATFPYGSLVLSGERPDYKESNRTWTEAKNPRAEVDFHLVIKDRTGNHLSLDLLDWLILVESKIVGLSENITTGFNVCISEVETVYDDAGKWAWMVVTLTLGAYKS